MTAETSKWTLKRPFHTSFSFCSSFVGRVWFLQNSVHSVYKILVYFSKRQIKNRIRHYVQYFYFYTPSSVIGEDKLYYFSCIQNLHNKPNMTHFAVRRLPVGRWDNSVYLAPILQHHWRSSDQCWCRFSSKLNQIQLFFKILRSNFSLLEVQKDSDWSLKSIRNNVQHLCYALHSAEGSIGQNVMLQEHFLMAVLAQSSLKLVKCQTGFWSWTSLASGCLEESHLLPDKQESCRPFGSISQCRIRSERDFNTLCVVI